MRIARSRSLAVTVLGALLSTGALVAVAPSAVAAYDPSNPPYTFDPVNDVDTLSIYDATSGAPVTSGSTSDVLSSYYFVSSRDWSPDHTKAQLLGYLAEAGKAQGAWSGQLLGAATTYPVTTAPAPVNAAGTRPVARGGNTNTFGGLAASYPNNAPSTSDYYQLYQVRVRTTYPAPTPSTWASADLAIDPAAGTWRLLRPGAKAGVATSTALSVSPVSPAASGSTQTLSATTTPSGALGSIQFLNGSTQIGSPATVANGSATLSTSLPVGNYTLSAKFTPTDPASFQPSLSNSVGYQVTAGATVPDPPQLISVDPSDSSAVVTFGARGDGGSAITGYTLSASSASGPLVTKTVANDSTLKHLDGGGLQATLPGLTNGRTYSVTVAAVNSVGTGAPSDPPVTVVPTAPTVPAAPTAVSAAPGDGQASVGWTAASDGGSPITSYTITATPSGATPVVFTVTTVGGTVAGLVNGTEYAITVQATNALGTGPASNPAATVTPRAVAPPGAPTSVTTISMDSAVGVTWQPPSTDGNSRVTGYQVTLTTAGSDPIVRDAAGTSALLTDLINGVAYGVVVVAVNAVGDGAASPLAQVTPMTTPNAPGSVAATASASAAVVHWVAPSSDGGSPITAYVVRATPVTAGDPVVVRVANVLTATVKGLTVGTTYSVNVAASNVVGAGPVSLSATVTPYTAPGAPGRPVAQAGDRAALVSFRSAASNGSRITRYLVRATPGGRTVATARSPILVTGLANGTAYTFTVVAYNAAGRGPVSLASGAVRPAPRIVTRTVIRVPALIRRGRAFVLDGTVTGAPATSTVLLRTTLDGQPTTERRYPLIGGRVRLSIVTAGPVTYRLVYRGDLRHAPSSAVVRVVPRA